MSALDEIKRRDFLRTAAGVIGGATLIEKVVAEGSTPVPAPGRKSRAETDKIVADLDAKSAQFFGPPKEEGQTLSLLVKLARAKSALLLGAGYGLSAIWIALGLEETDGKLTTIEIKPDRVELAKKHLAETGLAHRVTCLEGDAHQAVTRLDGPFDFVYLDADKSGALDYFNKLFPKKLPPGGLLVAHNAVLLRDKMKDFLEMIAGHPDFDSVILRATPDDGFCVSYRRRA
jgi:predicted O-methyltransferase YrrM